MAMGFQITPYYVLFVSDDQDKYPTFFPIYGDNDITLVDDLEQEYARGLYLTQVRQLDLASITLQQTEEVDMENL
tara:strand:- start:702 stop:926 length:225 start_codon:yes stop_codon:yes gene_type:complete